MKFLAHSKMCTMYSHNNNNMCRPSVRTFGFVSATQINPFLLLEMNLYEQQIEMLKKNPHSLAFATARICITYTKEEAKSKTKLHCSSSNGKLPYSSLFSY